jgi:alkanesulfonate monooxygenase SsuD/methylene tetrahydromethanopterin reductase-like flavin-dependent oxidoreductase (luciferase family)
MDFFLMTEPQLGGSYQDLVNAARAAEEAGLAGFARADHYYWGGSQPQAATDAFTSLGGLARDTNRIRLTVLVSPITFRHPGVISKSAATLDQMSGGRFDLGLGAGWMDAEHEAFGFPFPERSERFARLEEALQYLRASFRGEPFEGRYYRLSADSLPRPRGLRMLLGGSGPRRTPSLAGRYADEYNLFSISRAELAERVTTMRAAAAEAGREPGSIMVSVMGPAVLASSERTFQQLMEKAAAFRRITVEELTTRWQRNGVPMGTPDRAAEAFANLKETGVERYYLQWLDLTDQAGIETLVATAASLPPIK